MVQKSLLWEAVQSLSKVEERAWMRFLQSPYFSSRTDLVQLASILLEHKSKGKIPNSKDAWPRQDAYSDQKFRQLLSDTLEQLERFIGFEQIQTHTTGTELAQAKAYLSHGLEKHFTKALREANTHHVEQPYRHHAYFEEKLSMEWLQYQYAATASRTGQYNLQSLADLTEQTFILQRLRIACLQANHTKSFDTEYQSGAMSFLLQYLESAPELLDIPPIGLYYACYLFLTAPTPEAHFQEFIRLLLAHASLFPTDELRTLYLLAINYAIVQVNAGRTDLVSLTLNLYQDALNRHLLFENGLLSRFAFTNIVAIALRNNETARARNFVKDYSNFLEKKYRTSIVNLNLARIAYAEQNFDAVLELLQKSDYKDLINNLIAKTLQLKVYYETKSFSLLESHLASLRIFIKRQKQIGYRQEGFRKLIQYTQLLMHLDADDSMDPQVLRSRVLEESGLLEREWLLQMIDRVEGYQR